MTRYLSICTFLYFIHVIAMTSCTIRHTVEYKSCYLDTVPDNKKPVMLSAPWPASKRFNPSDLKNQNSKYDDATLGTKPASLPYARVTSTGLRAPGTFPDQPHTKEQIEGAHVLVKPQTLKPDPRPPGSLVTGDIDGATTQLKGFQVAVPRDPQQPVYPLASCKQHPIPVPKFVRDSIPCDDIHGTRTAEHRLKLFTQQPRESATMYCDDISGTRSRALTRARNAPYNPGAGVPALPLTLDTLEAADVCQEVNRLPYKFVRTSRNTNPMRPDYRYNVPSNDPLQGAMLGHKLSGERPGIVPKEVIDSWTLPQPDKVRVTRFSTGAKFLNYPGPQRDERPGPTQLPADVTYREYMLISDDIEGAQHGTKGRFQSRVIPFYRTSEGTSNHNADIEKAQTNGSFTLLPAHILTKRLAESTRAGAVTARDSTRNPFGLKDEIKAAFVGDHFSVYRETFNDPKARAAIENNQNHNGHLTTSKQLDLTARIPAGPASQSLAPVPEARASHRPSTSAIFSAQPKLAGSTTPRTSSAVATPRGAATPRASCGSATPRAPRAAALDPKLLSALAVS